MWVHQASRGPLLIVNGDLPDKPVRHTLFLDRYKKTQKVSNPQKSFSSRPRKTGCTVQMFMLGVCGSGSQLVRGALVPRLPTQAKIGAEY